MRLSVLFGSLLMILGSVLMACQQQQQPEIYYDCSSMDKEKAWEYELACISEHDKYWCDSYVKTRFCIKKERTQQNNEKPN